MHDARLVPGAQQRDERTREAKRRQQVHLQRPLQRPVGLIVEGRRALGHDRGVVHQHVERPPPLGDLLGRARGGVGVGEIEREGIEVVGRQGRRRQRRARAGEARLVARDAEDRGPLGEKQTRSRKTNSARDTGDEDATSPEPCMHGPTS